MMRPLSFGNIENKDFIYELIILNPPINSEKSKATQPNVLVQHPFPQKKGVCSFLIKNEGIQKIANCYAKLEVTEVDMEV